MEKILTISIAAYNVEQYIRNTLDSLIIPEIMDDLEVFIVDDGGSDGTLSIAKEYERKYPYTFHAIHKENGGYGSTVNYSLAHATGRYFKLLDGDDWFNTADLKNYVNELRKTNADIVITNYLMGASQGRMKRIDYFRIEGPGIKQIAHFVPKTNLGMHSMTIKTKVLLESQLKLPEHMLYTDQYFDAIPFGVAETMEYMNYFIYCYRRGREGQSMSKNSRLKHYKEYLRHSINLAIFCSEQKNNPNYPYLVSRVGGCHSGAINALLLKPINKESLEEIKTHEKEIESISKDVYNAAQKAGETGLFLFLMRKTNYAAYWLLKLIPRK